MGKEEAGTVAIRSHDCGSRRKRLQIEKDGRTGIGTETAAFDMKMDEETGNVSQYFQIGVISSSRAPQFSSSAHMIRATPTDLKKLTGHLMKYFQVIKSEFCSPLLMRGTLHYIGAESSGQEHGKRMTLAW